MKFTIFACALLVVATNVQGIELDQNNAMLAQISSSIQAQASKDFGDDPDIDVVQAYTGPHVDRWQIIADYVKPLVDMVSGEAKDLPTVEGWKAAKASLDQKMGKHNFQTEHIDGSIDSLIAKLKKSYNLFWKDDGKNRQDMVAAYNIVNSINGKIESNIEGVQKAYKANRPKFLKAEAEEEARVKKATSAEQTNASFDAKHKAWQAGAPERKLAEEKKKQEAEDEKEAAEEAKEQKKCDEVDLYKTQTTDHMIFCQWQARQAHNAAYVDNTKKYIIRYGSQRGQTMADEEKEQWMNPWENYDSEDDSDDY